MLASLCVGTPADGIDKTCCASNQKWFFEFEKTLANNDCEKTTSACQHLQFDDAYRKETDF